MAKTLIIDDNPFGRVYAVGLTGGNYMIIVEPVPEDGIDPSRPRDNLSIPLDADQAARLGRFLFFDQAAGVKFTEPPVLDAEEDEITELPRPIREPVSMTPPRPKALGPAKERFAPLWPEERLRELAAVYITDEARDYRPNDGGRGGAVAYVAKHFGVPETSVGSAITRARKAGILTMYHRTPRVGRTRAEQDRIDRQRAKNRKYQATHAARKRDAVPTTAAETPAPFVTELQMVASGNGAADR